MSKRILLTDRAEQMVDYVLEYTDWKIVLLIIGAENGIDNKARFLNEPRIESVVTQQELLDSEDFSWFDYDMAEKCKHLQAIGDYQSNRILHDFHYSRYEFYNNMSFFKKLFTQKQIDLCIVVNSFHGFSCDYLLAEFAKIYKVPAIVFMPEMKGYTIFHYNNESIIPLLKKHECNPNAMDDFITEVNYSYSNIPVTLNSQDNNPFGADCLKSKIKDAICSVGGNVMFLPLLNLYRGNILSFMTGYHKCNMIEYFLHFIKYLRMKRYAKQFYVEPDIKKKYVIFFLHMEPEAVIPNYANIMESQLVAIGMIAQALPDHWTLYVKEHPNSCNFNRRRGAHYLLPASEVFFTKFFVDKIRSFRNTKIIPYTFPTKILIQNSRAVASVYGTVLKEGILLKKPVLIFANKKRSVLGKMHEVFFVDSMERLRAAMSEIAAYSSIDYHDYINVFQQYVFKDNVEGWEDALGTVDKWLEDNAGCVSWSKGLDAVHKYS